MKAVARSAAVVFAYLCNCWAAGSVFLAIMYDYDEPALYVGTFVFLRPVLGEGTCLHSHRRRHPLTKSGNSVSCSYSVSLW